MRAADVAAATGDYAAAGLPMPAERFYELRIMSGLSFRELADVLGMRGTHAATHLREMADGVRRVPGPTGVALQAIADGWRVGSKFFRHGTFPAPVHVFFDDGEEVPVLSVAVQPGVQGAMCIVIADVEPDGLDANEKGRSDATRNGEG